MLNVIVWDTTENVECYWVRYWECWMLLGEILRVLNVIGWDTENVECYCVRYWECWMLLGEILRMLNVIVWDTESVECYWVRYWECWMLLCEIRRTLNVIGWDTENVECYHCAPVYIMLSSFALDFSIFYNINLYYWLLNNNDVQGLL